MTRKPVKPKSPSAQTRRFVLIAAGLRLLSQGASAASLGTPAVAAAAGLTPAQFKAAFPHFNDYLVALLQRMADEVREETLQALKGLPADVTRIRKGITAYLDAMQQRPALLELTETLRVMPQCQAITRTRLDNLQAVVSAELKSAKVKYAAGLAHLGTAMLTETARAEYEARRMLADFRNTLDFYFERPQEIP